jgi:hypothetical protein
MTPSDLDPSLHPDVTLAAHPARARRRRNGTDPPTRRPGWYAYRVMAATDLPAWAVEVALTIERPAAPDGTDPGSSAAYGSADGESGGARALLLLRAPGGARWLAGLAEAIAEVEAVAGVRPATAGAGSFVSVRGRGGPQLLTGPLLPGLVPAAPSLAQAHLGAAGSRGLPAPLPRRRPAAGAVELPWWSGAGSVVTCDGPDGMSAQTVVSLGGLGSVGAIAPPPGGALVLRAWQARRAWGLACGLVLGAPSALGLGRAARRFAARARTEGWNALVLSGPKALQLARAGDPRQPVPQSAARAATGEQVAAMLEACLAGGGLGLDPQPADPSRRCGDPPAALPPGVVG